MQSVSPLVSISGKSHHILTEAGTWYLGDVRAFRLYEPRAHEWEATGVLNAAPRTRHRYRLCRCKKTCNGTPPSLMPVHLVHSITSYRRRVRSSRIQYDRLIVSRVISRLQSVHTGGSAWNRTPPGSRASRYSIFPAVSRDMCEYSRRCMLEPT